MEKTANFELSQWDKSDRIMMEDFNADNLKIDQAIHDSQLWVCLGEAAPSEDGLTMTFTVERPADYQEVTVYFTSVGTKLLGAALNDTEVDELFSSTVSSSTSLKAIGVIHLLLGMESGVACLHQTVTGISNIFSRDGCGLIQDLDLSAPLTVTLTSTTALEAGSGLRVFALKY